MTDRDVKTRLSAFGDRLLTRGDPDFESLAEVFFRADPTADGPGEPAAGLGEPAAGGPADRPAPPVRPGAPGPAAGLPAALVRPRTAAEVSDAVIAARDLGLPFAVRAGGHSHTRSSAAPGALIVDLRLLNGVTLDCESATGRAAGGATAGPFIDAAGARGLATGFGDTPDVGIVGLLLGGGIGQLSRRDGLTIDNLRAADVVLADGSHVRADERREPDLFWALRGGGPPGVGPDVVVTGVELRLRPTPAVVAGPLAFAPDAATLVRLVDAARGAPESLSAMVNVMRAPPLPFIPAERHGTPMIAVAACHSGDPADADAALAPLRAAGTAWLDRIRPTTYPGLFRGGPPFVAGNHVETRTGFLDTVTAGWAAAAVERVRAAVSPSAVVSLRVMGGAIARVPAGATAFAHRDRAVMATVSAMTADPDGAPAMRAWTAEAGAALGLAGGYVNFMTGGLSAAFPPETLERLRKVRAAYR